VKENPHWPCLFPRDKEKNDENSVMKQKKRQFERLVDLYAQDIHRFALWLTKDHHTAEDVVQEAYARAWKNLDQLKDENVAKSWLLTIVRNENARRFQRKQFDLVNIDDTQVTASADSEPENRMEISLLRKAIAALPEDYREPLVMQVLHGMSCREIAETMELPENTVMTRLFRAKQKVKGSLTETQSSNVARLYP
jgi:RNA polymerase sigma-70 factor (ECF subfamily)